MFFEIHYGEERKMCKPTCHKIIATIFIILAVALAITVSIKPQQSLSFIVFVSRFFDVMIPILAVGALIKYLTTAPYSSDQCCDK